MLRAKIHNATVTGSNLEYEGSITIDEEILKEADIFPYEKVMVSNLNNGERFETYVIPGSKGEVCLNGPTARKGVIGDRIIIFCYEYMNPEEAYNIKPKIIRLNRDNKIIK